MSDPRFFPTAGPFDLAYLAIVGEADVAVANVGQERMFRDVAPLERAGLEDVSFLDNRRYLDAFSASSAGACFIRGEAVPSAPDGMALLVSPNPYLSYARAARAFHPAMPLVPAISPAATVDETAVLGPGCQVDAGAVVGAGVEMGARCHIAANAVLCANVRLGDDCVVEACASLSHCLVGARVLIHMGARIGQDGFGFATGPTGHVKVPQLGRVVIEDDVEIGANTTIDRGAGPDTVIGAGTQIDNLVQIAHNVVLGKGCVVVAQVGISGSTKVGDYVIIGGQAGLTGHIVVGNKARIGGQSGVMRDVGEGDTVGGSPARKMQDWLRQVAWLDRMTRKGKGDGHG
jgi:UDP-3-O-[3-hydroxymyristoyl] glucosamine N-acyltransferase